MGVFICGITNSSGRNTAALIIFVGSEWVIKFNCLSWTVGIKVQVIHMSRLFVDRVWEDCTKSSFKGQNHAANIL